jgi:hypothetical protein
MSVGLPWAHRAHGIPEEEYMDIAVEQIEIADTPGSFSVTPDGATVVEVNILHEEHSELMRILKTYNIMDKALCFQITDAFDGMYMNALSGNNVVYDNVISLEMLNHVCTNYVSIARTELSVNYGHMNVSHRSS